MPAGPPRIHRVAIVGASSLRGKELKSVLEDRRFPSGDIVLLDASVMAGTLTEAAGEPTFIRALEEDSFDGVRFTFFAGAAGDVEQNWRAAQRAGSVVVDLTGALAAAEQAVPWIPPLDSALPPKSAGPVNGSAPLQAYSSPAAPVIISCTLAAALEKFGPQRIALVLFPPVSEREEAGVEELENQTASLLSFRPISQPVFDVQVAFNLLTGYGEAAKPSLADVRGAVARATAQYLAGRMAAPAIQLVQAPVFYGYAFAAYAHLTAAGSPDEIQQEFAKLGVKVTEPGEAPPSNVLAAGASEIQIASIASDPNDHGGVWVWGVADNLRLAATNAVRITEELVGKFPE
jgi:aspartate-semialdehyde dehydrogenase